jgi:hypothetical protein
VSIEPHALNIWFHACPETKARVLSCVC